jgi:hypothetical protein
MGASVDISVHYGHARRVQFKFGDVLKDVVRPLDVGNYLREGEVDADNRVLAEYVLGNGELFLITESLKARDIMVTAEDRKGTSVEVDLPAIQGALGSEVAVAKETSESSTLRYSGKRHLVFGFKCYRVGLMGGDITLVQAGPDVVALTGRALEQPNIRPVLLVEHGLVDLVAAT